MDEKVKKSQLARLGRIEGQVRGVARMIEEDRYCIDVLTQIRAVRAALDRVEQETLSDHLQHCVAHAFHAGDERDRQQRPAAHGRTKTAKVWCSGLSTTLGFATVKVSARRVSPSSSA